MNRNNNNITSHKILSELLSMLETVFISVFIITLIFTYLFRVATVKGSSMENTLMPKECIIASVAFSSPENGDIVIINADEAVIFGDDDELEFNPGLGKQIVKRVIAVGGQSVNIDFERGAVYVDGVMLDEPYITGLTHLDEGAFTNRYPFEIPEGYVFVMGDNRGVSKDSRSAEVGLVAEENIVGKVFFRLSPLEKFGFLD